MRQGIELIIDQRQDLILSPQLKQSIEILRFSMDDLVSFLREQALENPMMELEEKENTKSIEEGINVKKERENLLEIANRYDYPTSRQASSKEDEYSFLDFSSKSSTLNDELLFQLNVLDIGYIERRIGEEIIDNLDDNGYLRTKPSDIASEMGVSEEDVMDVLEIIRGFEPRGIGWETLKDCLLAQIDSENKIAKDLIDKYLEDIAYNRMGVISKEMNLPIKKLIEEVEYIKSLNPKPGASFATNQPIKYIVPDATIEKIDGEYQIIMHDEYIPSIRISDSYRRMIKSSDEDAIKFLSKKLNAAEWIISSIEQRKSTIQRILEVIVRTQSEFFDKGKKYLAPMSQKDVAEELELHESTISRATTDKYVDSPQGILELKYFFSSDLKTDSGEDISSKAIKAMIEEIIESENKKKPFSDAKITNLLNEKGIDISRRTVAKYRESIGIPKSSMRKEYI
ncbi:MAG: RNA polymerase factor sigma-54 [Tissierellia bacterium]|nr:RNA polymerase factor sigma-54 [Tissierellia bacterium]